MQAHYATEPEYKAPSVPTLAFDLLLAAVGASLIVGGSLYALGVL